MTGPTLKSLVRCSTAVLAVLLYVAIPAFAEARTVAWDPPKDTTHVAGYRLKIGTRTGSYITAIDAGKLLSLQLPKLTAGREYFLAVVSYSTANVESTRSNELILDLTPDTDGDGLSNAAEKRLGTNPNSPDSDGDGAADGQEVSDATNPLDRGSNLERIAPFVCAEWNSNLNMVNIAEYTEVSGTSLKVQSQLHGISGDKRGAIAFPLAPFGQFDLLVHALDGREANSYGSLCSSHDGAAGALDGRMVYYKPDTVDGSWSGVFQFAFAMPFSNGIAREQFVTFNTFQPSFAWYGAQRLVANWIQITNLSSAPQSGELTFYNIDGSVLASETLELTANARYDVSGHRFGPSLVGTVAWRPSDSEAKFQMRNSRYFYDNLGDHETFETAFQVQGRVGSGALLAAPLKTDRGSAILEVSNVLNSAITVDINIFNAEGVNKHSSQATVAAYGSFHLITDTILNGERGMATVAANKPESVFATVMQYERNADGGTSIIYGVPFAEASGAVIKGSYNNFLSQSGEMLLLDTTGVAQTALYSLVRSDGTKVVTNQQVQIPANGVAVIAVSELDQIDVYGTVFVKPSVPNSIVGWTMRRKGDEFVIPVPIR